LEQAVRQPFGEYGSDRNGLVWGYVFHSGDAARAVTSEEVAQQLAAPANDGSFFWLHFSLANTATERWLRQHANLPDAFYDALREASGPTRLEQDGEALVAVINDVLFDFHYEATDISSLTLAVLPRVMISARLKPLRSIDRLRESVRSGTATRSPVALLAQLLENQAGVLTEIVRRSNEDVNSIEDKVLVSRVGGSRARLSALRRLLVRLQRILAPEPAALFRLLNRPPAWVTEEDLADLRRSAEEFSVAVADCATLVERAKLVQEELAAMVNEQTNRSLFLLTFVTVIFLPFNVIGSLFGMNVGGIPLAKSHAGFWVIIFLVTIVTIGIARILLRQFRR
jgi:zinc transporter